MIQKIDSLHNITASSLSPTKKQVRISEKFISYNDSKYQNDQEHKEFIEKKKEESQKFVENRN